LTISKSPCLNFTHQGSDPEKIRDQSSEEKMSARAKKIRDQSLKRLGIRAEREYECHEELHK